MSRLRLRTAAMSVSKCCEPTLPSSDKKMRRCRRFANLAEGGVQVSTLLAHVRFQGQSGLTASVGNEVHIEVSHCFQASSLGTHLKAKSHRWICERMWSPGHVATLLFGLRA